MVDISPEANIFGIFRNLHYEPWHALAEFVDNSVSSWQKWPSEVTGLDRPKSVKVEIEVNTSGAKPYIEIRDNSSGIALADFDRAFKVASIPLDRTGLNEFGMGMKTAGFWFSNSWMVRTSYCGEPIARSMFFDLEKILDEKILDIEPELSIASETGHFTTIRLGSLNQIPKGQSIGKIKKHLTGIYRCFLRTGELELIYNGERLAFEEAAVLVAPHANGEDRREIVWKKAIDFTLNSGKRVTGFAALRETGSTTYAGFALFRKNRLIEGSSDEPFRPSEIFGSSNSYTYQRLFGEMHLDGFKVTHTKDAIIWEEGEQEEFVSSLKTELSEGELNLLYQAEKFRKKEKPNPQQVQDVLDTVRDRLEQTIPAAFERISPTFGDIEVPLPAAAEHHHHVVQPRDHQPDKNVVMRIETHEHGVWNVDLRGNYDEAQSNFFSIGADSNFKGESGRYETRVEVTINLAHPFALQHIGPSLEGSEVIFSFTSCLAIALSLGKAMGARSAYIVDYLNDILRFKGAL